MAQSTTQHLGSTKNFFNVTARLPISTETWAKTFFSRTWMFAPC